MKRGIRVALALAPGCMLLIAAVLVGAGEGPHPARAAVASRTRVTGASHVGRTATRRQQSFALTRDPFVPPPGVAREALVPHAASGARSPVPVAGRRGDGDALPVLRAVIAGEQRMALLQFGEDARVVRERDRLGAWRVLSIDREGVLLVRGDARLRLPIQEGS